MDSLLDWLVTLPPAALYVVLGLTAAIENIFPPFPSDVIIAFGSFVAAKGDGTPAGVFISTWLGNVGGAMLVYVLGSRYGAQRLEQRLAGKNASNYEARIRRMFDRFGMPAVFVTRFVPGVRALVPAFAGALRLPLGRTLAMIAGASAIWYGAITFIAFSVGADWEELREMVTRYTSTAGIVATVLVALAVGAWLIARRRRKAQP